MLRSISREQTTAAFIIVCAAAVAQGGLQLPLEFAAQANLRIQTLGGAAPQFPEGSLTFASTPFLIPAGGNNAWSAQHAAAAPTAPASLTLSPGLFGVSRVYTLINTLTGTPGPVSYAEVEFIGSAGAYYSYPLVGNQNIRDYLFGEYTNNLSTQQAVTVFTAGSGQYNQVRLDMQPIDLPEPFWGQRLLTVRVRDAGADGFQRVLVTAATAAVTTLITGDATLDGRVDVADFARLAANFNRPGGWQSGDFDQDGVVGLGDFGRLAANFNYAYPADVAPPEATVPEPAATAAAVLLTAAGLRCRRCRGRTARWVSNASSTRFGHLCVPF